MVDRFADKGMQNYVRDMAKGRPGARPEDMGSRLVWYPLVNGEIVKCEDAPFAYRGQAMDAAREFKTRCREILGESE